MEKGINNLKISIKFMQVALKSNARTKEIIVKTTGILEEETVIDMQKYKTLVNIITNERIKN
jgi:hypothetical protein